MHDPALKRVRLGAACSLITDGAHFSPTPQIEGRPIVNAKDIPNGRIELSSCTRISEADWVLLRTQNCAPQVGDVLLSKDGTIGRVVHYREDHGVVVLSSIAILRTNGTLDSDFLAHVLRSHIFDAQLFRLQSGSALNRLVLADIRKIEVPRPPLEVQQRIAKIISAVDDAIEQTEALIVKTQQIKAGLMHDLFTRGVTPSGKLKSGNASKTRFGLLPEGWTSGSLLDIADQRRQPILTGPFGADLGNDDFVEEGVPVLRIGNVQAGYLDLSDLLYVTSRKAFELQRYAVRSGDLLFARQGATTGRNALATGLVDGCLINYHIIRVALDHHKCAPLFIEAAFNGEIVKRQVERDKGRGTREGINTSQLKALRVPLAPVGEQRMVATILGAQNDELQMFVEELGKLQELRRGLMQDLLAGRVQVAINTSPDVMEAAANA